MLTSGSSPYLNEDAIPEWYTPSTQQTIKNTPHIRINQSLCNAQIDSMLYALEMDQKDPINIVFKYNQISLMSSSLNSLKEITPEDLNAGVELNNKAQTFYNHPMIRAFFNNTAPYYNTNKELVINFEILTKHAASICQILDTHYKDLKMISTSLMMDRNHKIRVYLNQFNNPHALTIITSIWDYTILRKIIALVPKFLNQLFGHEYSSELEQTCLAFASTDYNKWIEAYKLWLNKYNPFQKTKQKIFINLFMRINTTKLENIQYQLSTIDQSINALYTNLQNYFNQRDDCLQKQFYLKTQPEQNHLELWDYLIKNKHITNINTHNHFLILDILTPITYFDVTAYKLMRQNPNSRLNQASEHIIALFDDHFLNERYIIHTATSIKIDIFNSTISRTNQNSEVQTYYANPHIMLFNCWGTNKAHILSALNKKEYIIAIEQMIAATKNLNFTDLTVVEEFIRHISTRQLRKSIFDPQTNTFIDLKTYHERRTQLNETHQDTPTTERSTH